VIQLAWLAGMIVLGFAAWRGVPIWRDAIRRGFSRREALMLGLRGIVWPAEYWWGARLDRPGPAELETILAEAAARRGLRRIDNLHCPLCGSEIEQALTLTSDGRLAMRPHCHCPRCDFRLDSCRHCRHFLPGRSMGVIGFDWGGPSGGTDYTHGRCSFYREVVPVTEAGLAPHMVKALLERGYETIRAPAPIADSYVPLDQCRAFALDERRLRLNEVKVDRERRYLLRLLVLISGRQAPE
jgi:hypothetical protein